ncbi:MAG: hypothetical protein AAGC60_00485 [Acidobacteriota bacterium]
MPRYETNPPLQPGLNEYLYYGAAGFQKLVPGQTGYYPWWVLGPSTEDYNCVAWTLGVKDVELGEDQDPFPIAGVDEFYAAFGYTKVQPGSLQGMQQYDVLSYGPTDDSVSHVAVYLNVAGLGWAWTSKMGAAQLISHQPDQLVPGPYGDEMPAYYTHNGTMPVFVGEGGEEDFVRTWLARHGRGVTPTASAPSIP